MPIWEEEDEESKSCLADADEGQNYIGIEEEKEPFDLKLEQLKAEALDYLRNHYVYID